MKKNLLSIIIGVLLFQNIFAQNSNTTENTQSLEMHIMPLTLVNFSPRFRVGMDYNFNEKWGYGVDFGIGNSLITKHIANEMGRNKDFFVYEIRQEAKYFFTKRKVFYPYTATEMFFLSLKDNTFNDYYTNRHTNQEIYYTTTTFNKKKLGIHIKCGFKLISITKLNLDFYVGLGLAYRYIKYTNSVISSEKNKKICLFDCDYYIRNEGASIVPHATLGIKIGFIFWEGN